MLQFLGYFSKNCNDLPKVAQLAKNYTTWSPWVSIDDTFFNLGSL
jgi:hypothetical protein